jgi:hypothetical protein
MTFVTEHFGKLLLLCFGSLLVALSVFSRMPAESTLQHTAGTLTSVESQNGSNSTRYTEIHIDGSDVAYRYNSDSKVCGDMRGKLTTLKGRPLQLGYATASGLSGNAVYEVYDTWSEGAAICSYAEMRDARELLDTLKLYLGLGAVLFALIAIGRKSRRPEQL